MPAVAKMKYKSFAVTAVGIAHGTSTAARSRPRPRKFRFMMIAIQSPMTVSSATVTIVKKNVLNVAFQKLAPRLPGAHAPVPAAVVHCWRIQCA